MRLQTSPGIKVLPLFLSRESALSYYRRVGREKQRKVFFIFALTNRESVDSMPCSESKPL